MPATKYLTREPLHTQIAERLRKELATQFQPGDRFPSQNELGKRFSVSPLTAREAVGLLVQEGLLLRRSGSGTYVTERRPDKWVAIVCELDIGHPNTSYYFRRVVQLLRQEFTAAGQPARLYAGHTGPNDPAPTRVSCEEFYRDLANDRLLGVVAVATAQHLLRAAGGAPLTLPLMSDSAPGTHKLIDYPAMARQAARYLIQHGRRHLAYIEHGDLRQPSAVRDAFVSEAAALGVPTVGHWQVGVIADSPTPTGLEAFRALWQASGAKPDGLAVLDDVAYRELCPALLYNRIRVPEDLLVVSHATKGDPQPFIPPPARLEVDVAAIARRTAAAMLAQLGLASPVGLAAEVPITLVENTSYPALALV